MQDPRGDALETHLSSHILILDTSFALHPGFDRFAIRYAAILQKNHLLVPAVVVEELRQLASASQDATTKLAAVKALRVLERLLRERMAELRKEKGDKTACEVIQRVVEQYSSNKDMIVLSNPTSPERDIMARLARTSLATTNARVVGLDRDTQLPLLLYEPIGTQGARKRDTNHRHVVNAFRQATRAVVDEKPLNPAEALARGSRAWLADRSSLTLGDPLAEGGEGTIYTIVGQPNVCKIYRNDKLVQGKRDKIALMLSRPVIYPGIAWPIAYVTDASGVFRGYLMPRAQGKPLGHTLFLPKQFLQERPTWTRRDSVQLALTILGCFDYLHSMNVLVGDVNPQNILLVDAAHVSIVDCDSFQVEGFPCPVGTVNFSAPELQGQDFRTLLRTKEHELFAVATLLFMIMFPGKSPYSHLGGEDGATNIRNGLFPYTRDRERGSRQAPRGVWTSCWSHLTPQIKDAFTHSFDRLHFGQPRVSVAKWIELFTAYARVLSDTAKTFTGPRPQVGFDLSIMPHSRRYTESTADQLPLDGRSDYERLLDAMARNTRRRQEAARRPIVKVATTRGVAARGVAARQFPTATTPPTRGPSAPPSPGCALLTLGWIVATLMFAVAILWGCRTWI